MPGSSINYFVFVQKLRGGDGQKNPLGYEKNRVDKGVKGHTRTVTLYIQSGSLQYLGIDIKTIL